MALDIRTHYAYSPDVRYAAIGRIRLADGSHSESHTLFMFDAPRAADLAEGGIMRIAESLAHRTLAGFANPGDEIVEVIS